MFPTLQSCLESIFIYTICHYLHLQLKVSKLRGIFHSQLFPHIKFSTYISGATITSRIPESNLKVHSDKLGRIHCLFLFCCCCYCFFFGWFFFPQEEGESGRSKHALLSCIDIITAQSPSPYQACTLRWKYERVWRNSVVRIKTPYKISAGAGQVPRNSYMPAKSDSVQPHGL